MLKTQRYEFDFIDQKVSGKVYDDIDQQNFLLSEESRKTLQKSDSSSVQRLNKLNGDYEKQNCFMNI